MAYPQSAPSSTVPARIGNAGFCGGQKLENPRKNPRNRDENEQQTEPTYGVKLRDSNLGHMGGRWALSPMHHLCFPKYTILTWATAAQKSVRSLLKQSGYKTPWNLRSSRDRNPMAGLRRFWMLYLGRLRSSKFRKTCLKNLFIWNKTSSICRYLL